MQGSTSVFSIPLNWRQVHTHRYWYSPRSWNVNTGNFYTYYFYDQMTAIWFVKRSAIFSLIAGVQLMIWKKMATRFVNTNESIIHLLKTKAENENTKVYFNRVISNVLKCACVLHRATICNIERVIMNSIPLAFITSSNMKPSFASPPFKSLFCNDRLGSNCFRSLEIDARSAGEVLNNCTALVDVWGSGKRGMFSSWLFDKPNNVDYRNMS
jgi:hypothetical protein